MTAIITAIASIGIAIVVGTIAIIVIAAIATIGIVKVDDAIAIITIATIATIGIVIVGAIISISMRRSWNFLRCSASPISGIRILHHWEVSTLFQWI